ncbi:Esterase tropF [Ceratocystis fimbriata CBS 114723]|uniref:Esterase tropF n=1 Tax=Ceratocystis fimbriata CBS 114723 TaxID=1035309 RepID=A0A2C5WYS1_9PEZI|nr:Esterase tropF [Ceratocystis fimbriata CBS 114723]
MTAAKEIPHDLALPRILFLHGGGGNAEVFRIQARSFITKLSAHFRLVFAEAPFECPPHNGVFEVYGKYAPFRRWLRWLPEHPEISPHEACSRIQNALKVAMDTDAGTGPWVGVFGFSQGSKMASSILFTQQALRETLGRAATPWNFRFGVLMAGAAPPVSLDMRIQAPPGIDTADKLGFSFNAWPNKPVTSDDEDIMMLERSDHLIRIPTIHIHGLKDPGLIRHQRLLELYSEPGSAQLIEWDGDHRIPIARADVDAMCKAIVSLAQKVGVLRKDA